MAENTDTAALPTSLPLSPSHSSSKSTSPVPGHAAEEYERSSNDLEAGVNSTNEDKVARAPEQEGIVGLPQSKPETKVPDPNIVTWDGPDDP